VLRPGGRIGILDLDSTSWVISHPNRDLTLRIGALAATIATDGVASPPTSRPARIGRL